MAADIQLTQDRLPAGTRFAPVTQQRIGTQHAARRIDDEPRLDHDQEHVGPRPFVVRRIEAEPQVERPSADPAARRRGRTARAAATRRSPAPPGRPADRTRARLGSTMSRTSAPCRAIAAWSASCCIQNFRPSKLGGIFHSVCCHHIAPISTRSPQMPRLRGVRCAGSRRQTSAAMAMAGQQEQPEHRGEPAGLGQEMHGVVQRIGPHGMSPLVLTPAT